MTTVYVMRELDRQADFVLRSGAEGTATGRITVDFGELANNVSSLEKDLGYVASALLACEELHNKVKGFELGSWIRFLVSSNVWDNREVKRLLQEIFSYATRCSISPRFEAMLDPSESSPLGKLNSVCLFSGGVDSLNGILTLPSHLRPSAGMFVSHTNLGGVVNRIRPSIERIGTKIYKVSIQRSMTDIQQLRGFVYVCFGAILSKLAGSDSIVISETGPTMYQPPYLPTDQVTLTTSPFLLELTKRFLDQVLGLRLEIYEPFEDMTKAEAMAICPEKPLIRETNSCITSRWAQQKFSHCGRCLGCVVRRLSAIVADVEDAYYAWDVAMMDVGERVRAKRSPTDSIVKQGTMDDLLMLLRFTRGMLTNSLPPYTLSSIKEHKKEELFKRFALDIVAASEILRKKTRNRYVKKFYDECIKDSVVTRNQLQERIAQVRAGKVRPSFNPRFS